MPRALPILIIVGLAIYSFFDVLQTEDDRIRRYPKTFWMVASLIPIAGAALWFIIGRPRRSRAGYGPPRVIHLKPGPSRPVAPDDDPAFLKRLEEEAWRRRRQEKRDPGASHPEPPLDPPADPTPRPAEGSRLRSTTGPTRQDTQADPRQAGRMLRAGVDLGGTKIQAVVCDDDHQVLGDFRCPTPTVGGPADVADAIADAVRRAAEAGGASAADVTAVGVGAPGQIDIDAGTVTQARNLPDWDGSYALGPELGARLGGIPTALGNDVQVAVRAELELGAGRPFPSFLGVFCGTGVGGGVVLDRTLWLGRGAAGEIGHTLVMADGRAWAGRHGVLEAYAGRAAMEVEARRRISEGADSQLLEIMAAKGKPRMASGVWAKAIRKGDPLAVELIDQAVWALGNGIASAVNLLDVPAVIIGGGLGLRLGQPFVDRIAATMVPQLVKADDPPEVMLAELGDLGGAVGASLLVAGAALPPQQREPGLSPAPAR
ncbi:MAG: ROK family protein [Candidatus Nanopelagicales bacterium]